jgi:hypothetical protein
VSTPNALSDVFMSRLKGQSKWKMAFLHVFFKVN